MTSIRFFPLTLRAACVRLAAACAAFSGSSVFALDLTNLINQATTLQGQARQIQSLIPGQANGAAPAQQAPQVANQAMTYNSPAVANTASASGQMQVVTAIQMQWRADGCVFTQAQEISCQITVLNQGADRKLYQNPNNVSMIDSQGTEYRAKAGGFGKNESQSQVFANGVATVGVFRFRNVDPSTVAVKRLALNGQEPIVWSDVTLSRGGVTSSATPGNSTGAVGTLGGLFGQSTSATPATTPAKTATLVASGTAATTNATAQTTAVPSLVTAAQSGTVQTTGQDSRRAQHMAARAAMAASAGKASH